MCNWCMQTAKGQCRGNRLYIHRGSHTLVHRFCKTNLAKKDDNKRILDVAPVMVQLVEDIKIMKIDDNVTYEDDEPSTRGYSQAASGRPALTLLQHVWKCWLSH